MALKFFPRESTGLLCFLREYNISLAFCSHPSLTSALGIIFSTPTHYVFAQQPSLYGDLFDVIVPDVSGCLTWPQQVVLHQLVCLSGQKCQKTCFENLRTYTGSGRNCGICSLFIRCLDIVSCCLYTYYKWLFVYMLQMWGMIVLTYSMCECWEEVTVCQHLHRYERKL